LNKDKKQTGNIALKKIEHLPERRTQLGAE
jgi:hypothetical protein